LHPFIIVLQNLLISRLKTIQNIKNEFEE